MSAGVTFSRAFGQGSGIQPFSAQVTEVEEHHDTLTVTRHPVETGAAISDHAYKEPPEVTLRLWWTARAGNQDDYVRGAYAQLLALQNARKPFDLYTGKRVYANMLLVGLTVDTDQTTEYALKAELNLRNVILVNTKTVAASSQQSQPEKTADVSDQGSQSTRATTSFNDSSGGGTDSTASSTTATGATGAAPEGQSQTAVEVPVATSSDTSDAGQGGNATGSSVIDSSFGPGDF